MKDRDSTTDDVNTDDANAKSDTSNIQVRHFDVATAVDDLRHLIAKAEALAHAAEDLFDETVGGDDVEDRRDLERLAHLIAASALAVQIALDASAQLATEISTRRTGAQDA